MTIVINGSETFVADEAFVTDAVTIVRGELPARGIAVAVNGEVVPRALWSSTQLRDGDRIEILTAVAGG